MVLDSSAVIAMLHNEPGAEIVWKLVPDAVISAVNAAEVQGKLLAEGFARGDAWDAILGSVQEVMSFDPEQAELTGSLLPSTREIGLSLGDRACLALGRTLQIPVYTADRSWGKLRMDVDVRLIR